MENINQGADMLRYFDFSSQQSRLYINSQQTYGAWVAAKRDVEQYRGWLTWKKVNGSEYLIKIINDKGSQKSLGPRSPETEVIFDKFKAGKERSQSRLMSLNGIIHEQAQLNKAVKIGHMPAGTAKILRAMDERGVLGRNMVVVGTNAIYAYEALAGVMFPDELMETTDVDFLWDSRSKLTMSVWDASKPKIIEIIKSVDPTFVRQPNGYSAMSDKGFLVEIIKPEKKAPWLDFSTVISEGDFTPSPIKALNWLVNAPKIEAAGIDEKGFPFPIVAPDPRAFVIYKFWMGRECPDRAAIKRKRDIEQAEAVAQVIIDKLPTFPFSKEVFKMFPRKIVETNMPLGGSVSV